MTDATDHPTPAAPPAAPVPSTASTDPDAAKIKSRIMQRILVNDAEIRHLAEPWLQDLDEALAARSQTLH